MILESRASVTCCSVIMSCRGGFPRYFSRCPNKFVALKITRLACREVEPGFSRAIRILKCCRLDGFSKFNHSLVTEMSAGVCQARS